MTTAALLQATSVLDNLIVEAAFTMAGAPGGQFVSQQTDIVASVASMLGSGQAAFVSEPRIIVSAALTAAGSSPTQFVNGSTSVGTIEAAFFAEGRGIANFVGADAQPIVKPLMVRMIAGPESGIIPVEVVDAPGPDVINVKLHPGGVNYTPIFIDPTNPMRKKVFFTE